MKPNKLTTDNPELLHYITDRLHITVLGGIKDNKQNVFRHNVDLYNTIQTSQLIERVSEFLSITTEEVNQVITELTTALEVYRTEHLESLKPKVQEKIQLTESQRKAAVSFLKSPGLLEQTKQLIAQSGIIGEETNALIAYLVYTSRKRTIPLHLMCLGASGTGKTWLQEKVGELMPEEDKLEITTLTANAFYYFGKEELKHKLFLIEDLDGAENVMYPLRELQSKRKISKTVTLKDSKGNMKTMTLNVEGPVCVSGCTTREELYEDNANRCILLYMDNSKEQDDRIMEYQRKLSAGHIDQSEQNAVKEQLKNVQRILQKVTVRNPYATYLKLPDEVFKPRRTMWLLLLFIETVTYYHQYQRELKTDVITGEMFIETTLADIEAALTLLEVTLLKKSDELNDACRNFFEKLKAWLKLQGTENFYSKDIRSALRLSHSSMQRYLAELEKLNYIKIIRGNRYKGFEYKVSNWNDLEQLQNKSKEMIVGVLEYIQSIIGNPPVTHNSNELLNPQKKRKKPQ
ncbi:hypothetical protein [Mucilaginibacter panaciglaebae]|uniref:Uncharacterized protein n=1 Tax=Mucilaginibacter panaciglaebae TaxID=502331 RepID=A0ABP7WQ02_9SPHI